MARGRKPSSKGCATCRQRRVRCDKNSPKCKNCTDTERVCRGWGGSSVNPKSAAISKSKPASRVSRLSPASENHEVKGIAVEEQSFGDSNAVEAARMDLSLGVVSTSMEESRSSPTLTPMRDFSPQIPLAGDSVGEPREAEFRSDWATIVVSSPIQASQEYDRRTELSFIPFEPLPNQHNKPDDYQTFADEYELEKEDSENGEDVLEGSESELDCQPGSEMQYGIAEPPLVTFTLDDRVHSSLSPGILDSLFHHIIRNFQVFLGPNKVYPLDVLIWKQSLDFYSWYMVETKSLDITVLRFAIFNAKSGYERAFYIQRGDERSFRQLKQYLWDFFWMASNLRPGIFGVQVMTNPLPRESFRYLLTGINTPALAGGPHQVPAPVVIRVQIDGLGRLSDPYDKLLLGEASTANWFFTWFAHETGRGGDRGPPWLRFTFKDAVPIPISRITGRDNEEGFKLLKSDLRDQFARASKLSSKLEEFVVIVTVPGWDVETDVENEKS